MEVKGNVHYFPFPSTSFHFILEQMEVQLGNSHLPPLASYAPSKPGFLPPLSAPDVFSAQGLDHLAAAVRVWSLPHA